MLRATGLIAGLILLTAAQASVAQQASQEDFQAWRAANEGRWVGEVTWIADWPGLGKKGDKVTAYSEIQSVANGNALVGRFYGGNGTGVWITVYDAAARQIRNAGGDSGGRSWVCVVSRQGRQWKSRCSGSLADGSKTEGDYTMTVSDNGNTHTWTGSTTIGGQAVDPLRDVFRRVGR